MPGLLEPLPLGDRVAPNRILFGPHETNLGDGRSLSDRHRAYYQERAAGGCGTIVIEEASVHPSDWPYERAPDAAEASAGWAAISAACHGHGTLVLAAIGHAGGQGSSAYSQRELWAPSDEPEVNSREVPKVMEAGDIDAVIAGFEGAATAAVGAGLDGVEVNAGQHSLIRQFLSGLTNRRQDDHGTDRLRFAREALTAARSGLGASGVLGLRLSCDELAPWAGLTPEAAVDVARQLAPLVDYLVVVRGSIFSVAETRPTGHHGTDVNVELCRSIRAGIDQSIPVIAQGSIVDPQAAEAAIGGGACDGVEMTRALIAEPRLVTKLVAGRQPRPCLLCNQRCKVRDNRNPVVSCVVEPRSGFETVDEADDGSTANPRNVLIVGAGPAGLEAAAVAAARGHRIRVVDAAQQTGGWLRSLAVLPGQTRFALLADWLTEEATEAGATIELGVRADAALVDGWDGPVIVATGGRPGPPSFEVDDDAIVLEVGQLIETVAGGDDEALGATGLPDEGPILVWDPIGNGIGVGAAEILAGAGRSVVFCTPDPIAGTLLALTGDLAGANVRLQQAQVLIERRQRLIRVGPTSAVTEHVFTGDHNEVTVAAVIDCGPRLPDDRLVAAPDAPAGNGPGAVFPDTISRPVVLAGDAVAPRTVAEAIREGRAAALELDRSGPADRTRAATLIPTPIAGAGGTAR